MWNKLVTTVNSLAKRQCNVNIYSIYMHFINITQSNNIKRYHILNFAHFLTEVFCVTFSFTKRSKQ